MSLVWKDVQFVCGGAQISGAQISGNISASETCVFDVFRSVHLCQADFYDEVIFFLKKNDIYYLFI